MPPRAKSICRAQAAGLFQFNPALESLELLPLGHRVLSHADNKFHISKEFKWQVPKAVVEARLSSI